MIKLFRKIRQNLLTESNTSKYLRYAFGEILLVTIGILIALQINNLKENRNEQLQEINYLAGIKTDLEDDLDRIEGAIQRYHKKISKFYFLDTSFILPGNFTPTKYTIKDISVRNMIHREAGFRLTMGSYKVLSSNSFAGLIKNEILLQTIQELYETQRISSISVYDDIKIQESYIGQKYSVQHKHLSAKAFFIDNPNKKEVIADFDYYYIKFRLYYNGLRNMRKLIAKTIDDISLEIKTHS